MEKDPNKLEKWRLIKDILSDGDKSKELHDVLASNEETIHEKLWNLNQEYWITINKELVAGEKISEKDVQEMPLSEVENEIEKRFGKSSIEYKVFQKLKKLWLRVLINTKTDISYTYSPDWTDRCNILRWRWPVTEQSKSTMMYGSDTTDEEAYITKLAHEMWHGILIRLSWPQTDFIKKAYNQINKLRKIDGSGYVWISVTKLWDIDRYKGPKKINEDCVELLRMYMNNPENLKDYIKNLTDNQDIQNDLYESIENCVLTFLNN